MATTHSKNFELIREFYSVSWDDSRVHDAVVKGWLTEAEYKTITGKTYKAA